MDPLGIIRFSVDCLFCVSTVEFDELVRGDRFIRSVSILRPLVFILRVLFILSVVKERL